MAHDIVQGDEPHTGSGDASATRHDNGDSPENEGEGHDDFIDGTDGDLIAAAWQVDGQHLTWLVDPSKVFITEDPGNLYCGRRDVQNVIRILNPFAKGGASSARIPVP